MAIIIKSEQITPQSEYMYIIYKHKHRLNFYLGRREEEQRRRKKKSNIKSLFTQSVVKGAPFAIKIRTSSSWPARAASNSFFPKSTRDIWMKHMNWHQHLHYILWNDSPSFLILSYPFKCAMVNLKLKITQNNLYFNS